MKRIACVVGVVAVMVASALATGQAGAEDEATSIKAVMNKLHKGPNSPLGVLKAELKDESPDWPKIQDQAKDFVMLGAFLSKNDPPKGNAQAFKKLAMNYYQGAKNLDDAAQKKDAQATKAAFSKIAASCKDCHQAHKGK
jgi:cytochrome c556